MGVIKKLKIIRTYWGDGDSNWPAADDEMEQKYQEFVNNESNNRFIRSVEVSETKYGYICFIRYEEGYKDQRVIPEPSAPFVDLTKPKK